MSASEDAVVDWGQLPEFALDYGFDDPAEPASVTVFAPDAEDVSAAWITVDVRHSVPLELVA